MPRPAGHVMSRSAWEDILRLTGRSLTEIAELAEVPRPTLSAVTRGHSKASVPLCHKIAAAADCHPSTLFPTLTRQSEVAA